MSHDLERLIPKAIFGYMLAVQLALPAVLFWLYGTNAKPLGEARLLDFFLIDDALALAFYAAGLGLVIAAVIVPRALLAKTAALATPNAAKKSLVLPAYVVKLVMFESIVLMGFVLGFLREQPYAAAPFLALGLAGTLMSPPRDEQEVR